MKNKPRDALTVILFLFFFGFTWSEKKSSAPNSISDTIVTLVDAAGRSVGAALNPDHVICSGAGCLRYMTYLNAQDRVVAVDDAEKRLSAFNTKPYALANPQFKTLPLFGEFRGHDNPELIVSLVPRPKVIFKTYGAMGYDPDELQKKTTIPVIVLNYGDLYNSYQDLCNSLRLMGRVMNRDQRAQHLISYFDQTIEDLRKRTINIPDSKRKKCYIGGISYKGSHGFLSTEPAYAPFVFTNAKNVAHDPMRGSAQIQHTNISKEKIITWNPEIIFVDVATMGAGSEGNSFYELINDPVYRTLDAVKNNTVYCVLPYNSYTTNFGSVLANAYYIGSVLYPEHFTDINPREKADEIYTFLVQAPCFDKINSSFDNVIFQQFKIQQNAY